MAMLEVQRIICVNSAAFVMEFCISYIDNETGETHATSWTDNYPVGQTRTIDGAEKSIPAGSIMWPHVHAILGTYIDGNVKVRYTANGQSATYKVTGTTLNFWVTLLS